MRSGVHMQSRKHLFIHLGHTRRGLLQSFAVWVLPHRLEDHAHSYLNLGVVNHAGL